MDRRGPLSRPIVSAALISLVTVAFGGASAGASTGGASTGGASTGGTGACKVLTGLTDLVVKMDFRDAAPPGPSVGDVGVYETKLVDADGKVIAFANGTGRILYNRESDGHLIVYYDDEYKFEDGSRVRAIGVSDVNSIAAGGVATQAAHGTAGGYRDYYGTREWTRVSGTEAKGSFTLCPDPA
jgi:hypothetical protein